MGTLLRRGDVCDKTEKTRMDFYNMAYFLRGQSSKTITKLSNKNKAAFVLKLGRPMAVLNSIDRYERLMKTEIDIIEH